MEECHYVDKTPYVERMVREGKHYFLSRPRRFGKSLFLDTLKEFFAGSEELFAGLHIHNRHDWSQRHPVVRLSFGSGTFKEPAALPQDVMAQLDGLARDNAVPVRYDSASACFRDLLQALHRQTGQRVAVLVDEYDKPILDALDVPEVARANRDYLRGLYGVIKDSDAHVRFTFLTGITKFSKVNLFSQLNNLTDITLDPVYSSICGYTEGDLDTVFAEELAGLDRERVREWYNGYSWLDGPEDPDAAFAWAAEIKRRVADLESGSAQLELMTRWNLVISDDTNRRVRSYLARTGSKKGDLSRFVDRAVRQAIFWETVEAIWERNRHLSGEAVRSLADEAVAEARADRP